MASFFQIKKFNIIIWGKLSELQDLFKSFFATISDTVSSITSRSILEAVDFCTRDQGP